MEIVKSTIKGNNEDTGEANIIYPKTSSDQVIHEKVNGREVKVNEILEDYKSFKKEYKELIDLLDIKVKDLSRIDGLYDGPINKLNGVQQFILLKMNEIDSRLSIVENALLKINN